ncbi:hypothetical protein EIH07_09190 [Chryseobacterium taklimakanense]|uniref:alpha-2-macroglobulin family protein n=1 Tax=Chryseobacterium taklimakanense TaxID=536441 RepID=UPI000F5E1767|nr:MG2 domain-containing protein [Chryseobacterium taklimakanense]AZI23201.1 hypothetical protein EIH07_09190 [Chryseobacterium taklimakanense]
MRNISKIFTFLFFLLLMMTPLFGQNYYDTQWKKIQNNSNQGLYKSNLPIILEIQNQAMKDNNAVQLIRSLKAEFSIVNRTRDDAKNDAASQFFKKLEGLEQNLSGEEKLVYQVLLGEFFNDYYRSNQWKINQRTNVSSQDFSQIETWSKLDFKNYLNLHFLKLEKESQGLKNIPMSKYKSIFEETQDLEYFPSLFEWNSIQYIDFLKHTGLFTPNEIKINHSKIISVYDELIAKNSGNSKLYFQHQKLLYDCDFNNCKDKLKQLQALESSSHEGDYKLMIMGDIIDELTREGKQKEAMIWVENAKKQYPKSPFLENIKNRENQITVPTLVIKYETHTQPEKPIHLVAEHKNVDEFSLNIYEVKNNEEGFLKYVQNQYQKSNFTELKKSLVRRENFTLQNLKDFKSYKTALEIKPLPSGIYVAEYIVENAVQENFWFIVTNSRIVFENKDVRNSSKNLLKLVDRENGKAIANETLVFNEYVNGKKLTSTTAKTDGKGVFNYPSTANQKYYRYYLVKSGSNGYNLTNSYGRQYYYENQPKIASYQAQIFLDRAIYRPGQTVYFKVITTKLLNEKESVVPNQKQEITLIDANGEEISKQTFTTNEFGSCFGSFTLPKGKLNGTFELEVNSSGFEDSFSKQFQVEEYKRPKFEVTFEPVKGEYKYGQTLEIKGKAMTFSGIPLSKATVNYEIKKRNIRWMYFWWYPRGNDNENSVLGSVKTNEKGEFTIKADLKKDETLDGIQVDNYQFSASVTDINGETQSAETNVKVASVSHYIKTDEVKDRFTGENVKIKVETKNYNDQNLTKSYSVKLSKLEAPKRIFRDNFKDEIQNLPQFSESEFVQKFPHDRFDKNDVQKNRKVEKVVVNRVENQTASNNAEQPHTLDLGKLAAGTYRLELYNIEGRDTIKTERDFEVFDKRFLTDSQKPFLKVLQDKTEINRGEKASVYAYSAVPDAVANIFVQNGNGETLTIQKPFKNGVLEYEVTAPKDESISVMNVQVQVVAFNDVQTQSVNFQINSANKPLRIETVTFRDKIQPNSEEKWTVKILGDDKERIQGEVLANMYDMSLDQFAANNYSWGKLFNRPFIQNEYGINENLAQEHYSRRYRYLNGKDVEVPQFSWFDGRIYGSQITIRGTAMRNQEGMKDAAYAAPPPPRPTAAEAVLFEEVASTGVSRQADKKVAEDQADLEKIPVRQNLNETAFFYPNLMTDKDGNVNFEFTSPEALTKWKMMFLAHTKDARAATLEKEVITQKDFSVTPNYPRFLREGDEMNLQTKLSNLTSQNLKGTAALQILDAFTNEDISDKFGISQLTAVSGYNKEQSFSLDANGNSSATWKLKVPNNVSSIIIKIFAQAGHFSDGEQKAIAVLPNRMLVTDAVPIFVKEGQTKTFILENLAKNNSTTATSVSNSLELTTNPIWEIMFALPSLKDDQNLSADVQFNKWFADLLASEIFKANPRMKTVFDEYQDKGLLTSNLEKNQELKQLLLEETPWVLESKNETEQMQKLARIFDANTMRNSISQDWEDLKKLQNPDGGFSWYPGYPSSYYTSLYILKNLGRINEWLKGNLADYQSGEQKEMVSRLVNFVDSEVHKYWDVKKEYVWNNYVLDYLDTRHYWETQYPLKGKGAQLKALVIKKAPTAKITDFTFFGLHRAALLFDAYKLTTLSKKLMTYLKETSTNSETQGVYWKQNLNDWGWYSSKTVNHAGALEAFNKLTPNDANFIEEMKIWLITQKEVSNWDTSRSTAEVIYTILNSGKSWTGTESDKATVVWGGKTLENPDTKATGYVKKTLKPENTDKNLGTVTITKPGAGIVQGGLFWQYYEDLDKIKSSETYISISKELYKKVKTVNGEELQQITSATPLKVGDKVTVRMILNTDRNMEFIHLKDMRAAGFEPLDVISGYQWKNSLGYYQSTKDASTNFYIEYMPKGKYVFEYDLICNASGTFSNGISTLQNYYAPQMNAHTKGSKVSITE